MASSKWSQAAGRPHVDGLPSGEGGGVGQDGGELLAAVRAERVPQARLDLLDVGFELGRDGRRAEPAVQQADRVGLALQDLSMNRALAAAPRQAKRSRSFRHVRDC
ncbi:MAG TPA: hypothetical protein VK162_13010 [Streptosporangiaceae bacterium]|nr:hypothetical protein [Streptosporangiaceae bacterium]